MAKDISLIGSRIEANASLGMPVYLWEPHPSLGIGPKVLGQYASDDDAIFNALAGIAHSDARAIVEHDEDGFARIRIIDATA